MPTTEYDFLIVGQGLAGSMLAVELSSRGQTVMVLDNAHKGSSSKVAAGLINPITGHRLNITEQLEQYIDVTKPFYQGLEKMLGASFYYPISQTRLIKNAGQADYFAKRLQQSEYQELLRTTNSSLFKNAEYGCAEVSQTAMVDTKELLRASREWLTAKNAYTALALDYSRLAVSESGVQYDSFKAKRIVFCEGYQAIYNPWLKDLPFKLAKGEILSIKTDKPVDTMLSWGSWLVPHKEGLSKLGSNFAWNDLSLNPNSELASKLLNSLHENTTINGEIETHEVGIRPTTAQRKPFIGALGNLGHAYCFNGLGSKGCLIAPFYTQLLCDHLLDGTPLPEEVTTWL